MSEVIIPQNEHSQELGRRLMNFYRNSFVPDSGVSRQVRNIPVVSIWNNGAHGERPDDLRLDVIEGVDVDPSGQFHVGVLGWARLTLQTWDDTQPESDGPEESDMVTVSTNGDVLLPNYPPIMTSYSHRMRLSEVEIERSRQRGPAVTEWLIGELATKHNAVTDWSPDAVSVTADVACHPKIEHQLRINSAK